MLSMGCIKSVIIKPLCLFLLDNGIKSPLDCLSPFDMRCHQLLLFMELTLDEAER